MRKPAASRKWNEWPGFVCEHRDGDVSGREAHEEIRARLLK